MIVVRHLLHLINRPYSPTCCDMFSALPTFRVVPMLLENLVWSTPSTQLSGMYSCNFRLGNESYHMALHTGATFASAVSIHMVPPFNTRVPQKDIMINDAIHSQKTQRCLNVGGNRGATSGNRRLRRGCSSLSNRGIEEAAQHQWYVIPLAGWCTTPSSSPLCNITSSR